MKKLLKSFINQDTLNNWHRHEARFFGALYRHPGKKLKIIGVTGTNGKTSVCHYVTQMLEESGKNVGMLTTVDTRIAGKRQSNTTKMTTLPASKLQSYLSQMVKAGCEYAVIETTSHALDQNRVHGLYYDAVAFTNLTHDHLDYHQSMADYQKAKEKLFANHPKLSVVNADDLHAADFAKYPADLLLTYGILDQLRPKEALLQPKVSARLIKFNPDKTSFKLETPYGSADVVIPLPGRFTLSNTLAAVSLALGLGVPFESVVQTLSHLEPVEGRLEPVYAGQPFSVIVDFAHTPDALEQVYATVRPMVKGKLIAVLGATGNRDKTKRPILGALASQFADLVIITNEDPYKEDPLAIIDQVASGIPKGRPSAEEAIAGEGHWWWRVPDRKEAIAKALSMAEAGDMVLITGKGGEHVMAVGDKLIPYNDIEVVKEILKKAY